MCWWKKNKVKTRAILVPDSYDILPYPEQEPDYSRNIANTTPGDARNIFDEWMTAYLIPPDRKKWWEKVKITLDESTVAATDSKNKHLWISPVWLNPGVIAHEMAHISYWQLKSKNKDKFDTFYRDTVDPLVLLVKEERTKTESSMVETHAEIYRFLGKYMPESFMEFYPFLF